MCKITIFWKRCKQCRILVDTYMPKIIPCPGVDSVTKLCNTVLPSRILKHAETNHPDFVCPACLLPAKIGEVPDRAAEEMALIKVEEKARKEFLEGSDDEDDAVAENYDGIK